eukprot:CAMPEP_0115423790 /NCGR_PEP_ID=MMETSP0271-20121206/27496_1 /TAXON_ID=71861 /ORGANISM="Scrippsiella trochoidea, Strain CCMP3099" /LENGTH=78 /DNA_ID=CAMNT_0002848569 /DNA_START=85 /DNA_END=318 /DNA_ORIENTATION=+
MAGQSTRRSAPLLPACAVAVSVGWLLSNSLSFLNAVPANQIRTAPRTAMRGFKEDFEAWRSSLTPEEQKMVQTQAAGE